MPDPKPKRRWFRFSLRTLLIVVTLFGLWMGLNLAAMRERRTIATWIVENGGASTNGGLYPSAWHFPGPQITFEALNPITFEALKKMAGGKDLGNGGSLNTGIGAKRPTIELPAWRRWLGDVAITRIELPEHATRAEVKRAREAFPDADLIYYRQWSQQNGWTIKRSSGR